ncbi:MAG: SAM-dependent methyltransferase [Dehalococcoidia bacterium]|nr:SAM-dependent methyltransferase [Dehalococcoidia bacterium]
MANVNVSSSFRDPSGFLFIRDEILYRQVNTIYKQNYDHLINSGLYESLVDSRFLIPHEEVDVSYAKSDDAYKVVKPEPIEFISYPYEWCFSQLKDAALTTLKIQKRALEFGMTLKDCSAYNIQFMKGKPVFIDTLSFEKYHEGEPWVAYKQFCQHFLAPLALMRYKDIRLNQLLRVYIDGIPLDLAGSLLPFHSRFNFHLLVHIHFHSRSQKHYADKPIRKDMLQKKVSLTSFLGLIDSLESCVKRLKWRPRGTEWVHYYESSNHYNSDAIEHKKQLVSSFLDKISPQKVWDLGANIGLFSRIASNKGIPVISFDIDPACVEINYLTAVEKGETNILPLVLDLTNPSPGIGWENEERTPFLERGHADTGLALALIHHLAISNNLPLDRIASLFNKICSSLIIEFVPKSDPMVQKLLATREDIFPNYTQEAFESEFGKLFSIQASVKIRNSERTLYLMVAKEAQP